MVESIDCGVYASLSSVLHVIRQESATARWVRLKILLALFRLSGYAVRQQGWRRIALFPVRVVYKLYSEYLLGIELPPRLNIGPGLMIYHGYGLVVHPDAQIGARCTFRQGVCIGNRVSHSGQRTGLPIIGDDVDFGVHAIAIGPIKIGDRAKIGAGTVVTKDVPSGAAIVGAPSRILND